MLFFSPSSHTHQTLKLKSPFLHILKLEDIKFIWCSLSNLLSPYFHTASKQDSELWAQSKQVWPRLAFAFQFNFTVNSVKELQTVARVRTISFIQISCLGKCRAERSWSSSSPDSNKPPITVVRQQLHTCLQAQKKRKITSVIRVTFKYQQHIWQR